MSEQTKTDLEKENSALQSRIKLLEQAVLSATVVANELPERHEHEYPRLAELLGRRNG